MKIKQLLIFFSLVVYGLTNCNGHSQQNPFTTHYRLFGKGQPILIINGGPGMNSNGFADMAKTIADLGYSTIIYDQRGTGKSTLDTLNENIITMDLMIEDIENLRKELKISKWTILGHSFGGILACHYYSKYSQNVEKLIFSSSGGVNLNFRNYLQQRMQNNLSENQRDSFNLYNKKFMNGDTSTQTRKQRASYLANAYVYNKTFAPLIATRLLEINFDVNGLVMDDLTKIKYDYTNKFKDKKTPVLVIQGKNDIISVETAQEIKNSFGNADIHLLSECGHYGWLDKPKEYFEAINQFLKR